MRRDVVKTQTIISDVQRDVVGIHRILKNREDNKGQYRAVSDLRIFRHHQTIADCGLDLEQVSNSGLNCS